MKETASANRKRASAGLAALAAAVVWLAGQPGLAQEATIIKLTQVACQFLESENGVDHEFVTTKKADCDAINARTGEERLAAAPVMELTPGKYIFRVTNRNVPYELGFWIREHDYDWRNPIHKLTKTSVSGGGLGLAKTLDYEVELEPGDYLYSCPLNTTPDYRLVVKD